MVGPRHPAALHSFLGVEPHPDDPHPRLFKQGQQPGAELHGLLQALGLVPALLVQGGKLGALQHHRGVDTGRVRL